MSRSRSCVINSPCYADTVTWPATNPRIGSSWPRWPSCWPGIGRSLPGHPVDAAAFAPGAGPPTLDVPRQRGLDPAVVEPVLRLAGDNAAGLPADCREPRAGRDDVRNVGARHSAPAAAWPGIVHVYRHAAPIHATIGGRQSTLPEAAGAHPSREDLFGELLSTPPVAGHPHNVRRKLRVDFSRFRGPRRSTFRFQTVRAAHPRPAVRGLSSSPPMGVASLPELASVISHVALFRLNDEAGAVTVSGRVAVTRKPPLAVGPACRLPPMTLTRSCRPSSPCPVDNVAFRRCLLLPPSVISILS